MKRKHPRRLRAAPGGFTLIEVLVAIVVLAFGLLGFALLHTMSVRFTQSANYRTQATNLAYDLIDQMRANRFQAAWYSTASFSPGTVAVAGACGRPTGNAVTIQQNVARWQCQVAKALGETASANVAYEDGSVTVQIAWGDQRWDKDKPDEKTTFTVTSQL